MSFKWTPFEQSPGAIKHVFADYVEHPLTVQPDITFEFSKGGKTLTIRGTIKGDPDDVKEYLERLRGALLTPSDE